MNEVQRTIAAHEGKICFVLTGSSARKLKREGADLLAGRALRFDFLPISMQEINFQLHFDAIMRWGLLPRVVSAFTKSDEIEGIDDDAFITNYLTTYSATYLHEDIQRETQLRKLDSFARLLEFAAIHNGEPVNQKRAATAAQVHAETAKEYYEILVDTLIAYEIPPWSHSVSEKMQLASKFYIFDNGVLNALTEELGSPCRPGTYRFGKLFENLVVTEFIKHQRSQKNPRQILSFPQPTRS